MIFADKVIELRKKNGWSQEALAEKLGVSRQTVSKWESAQSVPDFNRMIALSELFGVSTDYLLKDNLEQPEPIESASVLEDAQPVCQISMEEAHTFLEDRNQASAKIALASALCILSPVPLLLLMDVQSRGKLELSQNQAAGIGLLALILLVAAGVACILLQAFRLKPYKNWDCQPIETAYGVDGMVKKEQELYRRQHTRLVVLGILLCIFSVLPFFFAMILGREFLSEGICAALLLCLVAAGVLCLIRTGILWSSYEILLETEQYTRTNKQIQQRNEVASNIYWGIVVTLYLAYSFLTGNWGKSWIIWPVAGVLFGVFEAVLHMLRK